MTLTREDLERARGDLQRRPWRLALFRQQQLALLTSSRRKALLCGRRSGKTWTGAVALADALADAEFDEAVVYAARTRAIAKRLVWGKLHKLMRDHGLMGSWKVSETELTITNERGGYILLVGLDKPAEIEKLRGLKIRRVILDEPATYAAILEPLYDEVLEPACADVDGDIWLIGTPGKVLAGFWYHASHADHEGSFSDWERHSWTMFENPHMRDPRGFLERVLKRKGWTEEAPTVQQEYFGRWCADDSAQVYAFLPSRNLIDHVANYEVTVWVHTAGADFGVVDSCAWTVIASHPHSKEAFVLKSFKRKGLLTDEAADITTALCAEFRPDRLVGDTGGLGKPYVEEWNRRYAGKGATAAFPHGLPAMLAADKLRKRAHIELVNTELRTGRLKLVQRGCKELVAEIEVLPWADERREKEHAAYENHCADSFLYAFMSHYAYLHEAPEPRLADRDPDEAMAWIEKAEADDGLRQLEQPDWERF